MALINITGAPPDANDGQIGQNVPRIGNRTYGQRVFLSGTEAPIETQDPIVAWSAFETLTVSSTALPLTEALAENASFVTVTVESQAVRFRLDGVAPTATVGHVLTAGDSLELVGFWEIDQFRVIRRDASDATLSVSYGNRRTA